MIELENERKLVGVFGRIGGGCKEEEARVVFAVVFQMLAQDRATVNRRGATAGDGRARFVFRVDDGADAAGSVLGDHALEARMGDKELLALRGGARMRINDHAFVK